MPWIGFDFLPQTPHKDVDRARGHKRPFFPDGIEQLVAGKDTSPVPGQVFEEPKLSHGSEYRPARDAHGHGSDVNLQFSQLNRLVTGDFRRNAEDVADTRNQFAGTERFGDVSVATGVEGPKAVRFLSSGGKKNDGRLGQLFVLADLAAEIEAADPGQHNIEQKQRWLH